MKYVRWIIFAVIATGLGYGPISLESSGAAQPPIEWADIPFVFAGSFVGIQFVVGLQLFRKGPAPSLGAIRFFGAVSLWLIACGISALGFAAYRDVVAPHSMLFFAVGAGLLLGIFFCGLVFRWRFKYGPSSRGAS